MFRFEKCKDEDHTPGYCKSDEFIKEWLVRKFILTYSNNRRFRIDEFENDIVVEEARIAWIPVNTQLREEVIYEVSRTHAFL